MGANPYILAVDLGTSAAKLALVSSRGEIAGFEIRDLELRHLPGGGVEQSPAHWWEAVCDGARALVGRGLVPPEDIAAVSCTSQWSGTVAVDEQGEALGDALIWMDSRGAAHVRRAVGGFPSAKGYGLLKLARWVRLTGGLPSLSGKDSISHILYLRDERPDLYRATSKFLEPMDYLNLRLTGRYAASYATITLHWVTDNRDLRRVDYDPGLLRTFGIDRDKLPDLFPSARVLGPILPEVARALGLSEQVQVIMGTPDIHSAAVGSGAVNMGVAHLCIGTSSWLCSHVPRRKTDLGHSLASLPSAIPDRYLLVTEQESAALCLTWLRDNVLGGVTAGVTLEKMLEMAAGAPAGSDGLIFAPWLNGERMPVDDHLLRATFFNLSLHSSAAHLVRAVLEGVAYNTRWLLGYAERFVGARLGPIPAVGGGAASDLWCQIFADVLDRPIRQMTEPRQANVRGAGLIGAAALGLLDFAEVPERVPSERVFEPDPASRNRYDSLYAEYRHLYGSARRICSRLNAS